VLLILLGLTRGSDFSAREAIGDFLRIGVGVRHAKSPTGIRGKRTEALRHAAKWLKSSLETVWKIAGWVGWSVFRWRQAPKGGAPFRPVAEDRGPRNRHHLEFPDILWKEISRKWGKDSSGIHRHLVWSVLVVAVANVRQEVSRWMATGRKSATRETLRLSFRNIRRKLHLASILVRSQARCRKVTTAFRSGLNRRTYRKNHWLNGSVEIARGAELWPHPR
jgi:hypothetical protein